MNEPSLSSKVLQIEDRLSQAGIAHAFGGALALAYYAEPRATVDIDLNVFVGLDEHPVIDKVLLGLGADQPADPERLFRDGWFRYRWGRNPVDIFYAETDLHFAMEKGRRRVPFGDREISILGPEHLMVCKALFDRPKDWIDIEQMAAATPEVDGGEVIRWLEKSVDPEDPRVTRLKALVTSSG